MLIDPQSATIETDLSGLATGGGIGVLSTVAGVQAGNVDLIAPGGTVDAGDAGIRATGNLNIAAVQVLNADNIAASGSSSGVPSAPTVAAPNVSGLSSASSSSAASSSAANQVANQARPNTQSEEQVPSTITVEVLGYGGGEDENDDDADGEDHDTAGHAPGLHAGAVKADSTRSRNDVRTFRKASGSSRCGMWLLRGKTIHSDPRIAR